MEKTREYLIKGFIVRLLFEIKIFLAKLVSGLDDATNVPSTKVNSDNNL